MDWKSLSNSELIDAYETAPRALIAVAEGFTPKQWRARPVPGKWTAQELVAHLADFEPIYADRIKRAIATDLPTVHGAGHEAYLAHLAYADRDPEAELRLIELTRLQLARILRGLPDQAWAREMIFREGTTDIFTSVRTLFERITNHIPHHLPHLIDKRRALGLPDPS